MWIESLEELDDDEDFIDTWNVIINGLVQARQSIGNLKDFKTLYTTAQDSIGSATQNIDSMVAKTQAGLKKKGLELYDEFTASKASVEKCKDDEIKRKSSRDQQIASLTTQISAIDRQLNDPNSTLTESQKENLRLSKGLKNAQLIALQLKNMDSTNECATEERAVQRASQKITEHVQLSKLVNADTEQMSALTHDLEGNAIMTTQPVIENVPGVTVTESNLKTFNKSFTQKLVANTTASMKIAKELELTGIDQMSNSRPSLVMMLI